MMSRLVALLFLLCTGLAQAAAPTVLQRPIDLDTGQGVLHGSLLLPQQATPPPVVLIIAGSGPTDRDGNNPASGRVDNLKRLALLLANEHIASVRYDKRGVAASQPATPDERDLSVERYVADVVAWSRKLKADPRFGPLILIGHSEGALIASLAAEQAGASAVITLAGRWPRCCTNNWPSACRPRNWPVAVPCSTACRPGRPAWMCQRRCARCFAPACSRT